MEFLPEIAKTDKAEKIDVKSLADLAERIFIERENAHIMPEESITMQSLLTVGTSAGGRQPKAIIAINKATGEIRSGQVAGLQDYRLLYDVYLDGGMTHSDTLMPMIDSFLKMCGLTCADIDLYAVNAGPGSFTGLRIGLAAVKGLAFPRETLCDPVSTLEALAAAHTGEGTVLCALVARRAQVFSAAFDLATHTRLLDDDARAVADLAQFVENCKKPLFFVGDGASLCYNKYSNVPGVLTVPPELRGGRAAAVARVAKQWALRGEAGLPEALRPEYHRLSQAERERAERLAAEAAARNNDTENGKD